MLKTIKKAFLQSEAFMLTLMALTAVGITATGIIYKQDFFKMIPLYVSLVVRLLQSKAMRAGQLLGGINCIIYSIVYFSYGIYATALSSLLFECPLMLIAFAAWNRRKSGYSTRFRRLSAKYRILSLCVMLAVYLVVLYISKSAGGSYVELDTLSAVNALATNIATILSLIEYSYLFAFGAAIGVVLQAMMTMDSPELTPYLVFSIYGAIGCIRTLANVSILYKEQQKTEGSVSAS